MAELNFNALAVPGPSGFSQGFTQGRKEKTASEMDQFTLESGRFKLDELKRDRAEMLQLQEQLKGLGQDPDLNKFFDTISATGNPKYVEMANQGRQKLKDQLSFANILGGGVAPQAAPQPQPQAAPSEPYPGYNEEIGMAAPANALAARQEAPAPMQPQNAMAPQQPQNNMQQRINQAYQLGTPQALQWAKTQEANMKPSDDMANMAAMGYPSTPAGYAAYRAAQRAPTMLTPAEEAQKARLAAAGRSSVNVKLPEQEKGFETELGKGQAKSVMDRQVIAQDAANIIETVNNGRSILNSGAITGAGAEFLVSFNQALKTAGLDLGYADAATNSQAYAANMAQNVGRIIKQFGAGTGLSDADREYAEKMAAGKISLSKEALEKILTINEKTARNVVRGYNKSVEGVKTNIPLKVELPEAPKPKLGSAAAQIPGGRGAPMFAVNPSTGQRIQSTDGGNTWTPVGGQ
jgi:hypothetical protein